MQLSLRIIIKTIKSWNRSVNGNIFDKIVDLEGKISVAEEANAQQKEVIC